MNLVRWAPALLAGCIFGRNDPGEGPHCDETATVVALDDVTPLGFAASEVLLRLPASESVPLAWADDGATDLSLAFRPASDARFVESVAVYPEDGTWPAIAVLCEDYVQVDVAFDLATADGAFDEALDGALNAFTASGGEIHHELDLEGLTGSFDFDAFTDVEDYDERSAWVDITLGDGVTAGVIEGQVSGGEPCEEGDTCSAWAELVEIATWGPAEP